MAGLSLADLANTIGATVNGEPTTQVSTVAAFENATAGDITFITHEKYLSKLPTCEASVLIAPSKLDVSAFSGDVLVHDNPYLAYAKTVQALYPERPQADGIHASAVIADDVVLGDDVRIGPNAVIEEGAVLGDRVTVGANCFVGANVLLGDDVRLMPNVTLYQEVSLGKRTRIHSGVVIGADGFGYAPDKGVWNKIPQVGSVRIGDDVEIGANTTIDRGALTDTVIGNGVILDNQIQIGHNVVVGDHTAMAGAVAVGGSAVIGKHCQIGGGSGIAGHINIADNVIIMGMGMVTGSVKEPGLYSSGTGLSETKTWRRNAVRFNQLDDLFKSVRDLKKLIQSKDK
ncbi:UDP-3-O-(3-hydroxymyristoyl)glucosamine N-acyltransferase [Leucothrix sargassi]|nr:UDP-3-O-(3-hydroxymyristoyl)glucosamine N-acyltransferase [Leucothrix sargassi]